MGGYGGFFKGEKKKQKKDQVEKRASLLGQIGGLPQVEILGKKGKKKY